MRHRQAILERHVNIDRLTRRVHIAEANGKAGFPDGKCLDS